MHLPHALAFFVSSLWRPAALRCWSLRNGVGPKSEALAAEDIGPESEALAVDGVGPESEALAAEDVVDPLLCEDGVLLVAALDHRRHARPHQDGVLCERFNEHYPGWLPTEEASVR